jgi:hypothetical protein
VREPESKTAITIANSIEINNNRSTLFAFKNKNKPRGKPIAKTAANPAGLSKLPVIENSVAISVRFVPPISEWFVPLISVQTVPADN